MKHQVLSELKLIKVDYLPLTDLSIAFSFNRSIKSIIASFFLRINRSFKDYLHNVVDLCALQWVFVHHLNLYKDPSEFALILNLSIRVFIIIFIIIFFFYYRLFLSTQNHQHAKLISPPASCYQTRWTSLHLKGFSFHPISLIHLRLAHTKGMISIFKQHIFHKLQMEASNI